MAKNYPKMVVTEMKERLEKREDAKDGWIPKNVFVTDFIFETGMTSAKARGWIEQLFDMGILVYNPNDSKLIRIVVPDHFKVITKEE